ncbi:hypothetical protein [Vulgatibacter sp.]|uniref:hypothetical protein n=1 Tax=Vulgatibacter sp. TaxID=1971226 RepID=UPI003565FF9E
MKWSLLVVLALAACSKEATNGGAQAPAAQEQQLQAGTKEQAAGGAAGEAQAAPSREACVDAWLQARGLNEYGDPQGTMYTGGTPLFDESTGERKERLPYVIAKHPELAKACP